MKYIIGFSGGIDSTFVALYLKKKGHDILLVHLKNTSQYNRHFQLSKNLTKLSNKLNIPLKIINITKKFKKLVIDDFAETYMSGLTPNPCISCNWLIKFPILNKLKEELGYDKIATGHYAKIVKKNNNYFLVRPKDLKKDQTYMLYRIIGLKTSKNEPLLKYLDFPLGNFTKEEIKKLLFYNPFFSQFFYFQTSSNINLIQNYKESQNICFIPDNDYPRFLKQNYNIIAKPGPIYDIHGNYLGEHKGLFYYTIGQRRNIFLHQEKLAMNKKWYVLKIDTKNNILIVGEEQNLYKKEITITNCILHNNILKKLSYHNNSLYGKIRYHHSGDFIEKIEKLKNNNYKIVFKNPVRAPTPGQHLVIYLGKQKENDIVIGGGIITQNYI